MKRGLENVMVAMDQHLDEEEQVIGAIVGDTDIFLDGNGHENHLDVNDNCIFSDDFPPLLDFPCMSSSSSTSSSAKPPFRTSSSASSSNSASLAVLKSDDVQQNVQQAMEDDDENFLNVMEDVGYMDLIDGNDQFWDDIPACTLFQSNEIFNNMTDASFQLSQDEYHQNNGLIGDGELAVIFFEWLKKNKDFISAQDMRNIKLKRSTVESALKRLGPTKEGKKQLLTLILEWVAQYQLQKKRMSEAAAPAESNLNPNPNSGFQYNTGFYPSPWMPPPPESFLYPTPTCTGFVGNPYCNRPSFTPLLSETVNEKMEYQTMDSAMAYNPLIPENDTTNANPRDLYCQYPYQLFDENGERLGSSATKEARKKRMARQKHHYGHHSHGQTQHQIQSSDQSCLRMVGENITMCPANVYCPSYAPSPMMMVPHPERSRMKPQNHQKHGSVDKQSEGWKTGKNLKFLLQKVLKQSDVGNLGRIVLPKKEAECHLPKLESRDGISMAMEDIGTCRVWNIKYRFWPNNKSRMYLLENTGNFVRDNGLEEGDFIVIYEDIKCGKYLIRGVKVRPTGPKAEGKKPAKKNVRNRQLLDQLGVTISESKSIISGSSVAAMKQLVK